MAVLKGYIKAVRRNADSSKYVAPVPYNKASKLVTSSIDEDEYNHRVEVIKDIYDEMMLNSLNFNFDMSLIDFDPDDCGIITIPEDVIHDEWGTNKRTVATQIKKIVKSLHKYDLSPEGNLDVDIDDEFVRVWWSW